MVPNVTQIKSRTIINVNLSAKIKEKMGAEKVILRILVHLVTRMIDVQKELLVTHQLRVMKLSTQQKVL